MKNGYKLAAACCLVFLFIGLTADLSPVLAEGTKVANNIQINENSVTIKTSESSAGVWIGNKIKEILLILFSVATLVTIAVGAVKAMKLSSSNARNRSEAISDLMWWAIGAAVCFSATMITGLLYFLATGDTSS